MKFNISDNNGAIKEYCIACLNKSLNMYNLNENIEKRKLFTTLFNIELTRYREYPQFLCSICDIKLDIAYNFKQTVSECLDLIEQHNKLKGYTFEESVNIKTEENVEENVQENNVKEQFEPRTKTKANVAKRKGTSKVEAVPLDLVNKVVNDFKSKLTENKTCVICGFITANRRAISSHMALFHKEEKKNWCLECNKVLENYQEHRNAHSTRYQCPFCRQKKNLSHYVQHIQSHAGMFECDTCNKDFKSASWLEKHKRIHSHDKPYICPNCSKTFIQASSLRYHVRTHGEFCCEMCKKRYKLENDLQNHKCMAEIWIKIDDLNENSTDKEDICVIENRIYDSSELQNFCKACNKRVKSLSQHINKCHTIAIAEEARVNKFMCEHCEKTYSNRYKLKIHIRTHTGDLPFKCRYCNKGLLNRSHLKDHEMSHTKEKPYICNVCGKGLSQSSALRTHMKRHTGRPEVCRLCDKRFCRKSELRLHLSKHKGEKPFLCTRCGIAFAQKSHLTEHMARHSEARPFQCQYCQKAFKRSVLLKEHEKLHEGNKPFKCPSCQYACYKQYRLQQHMKQHSTDPFVKLESTPS